MLKSSSELEDLGSCGARAQVGAWADWRQTEALLGALALIGTDLTAGTVWPWVGLSLGFLVRTVGDLEVGEGGAAATEGRAAVAARVTRRRTEPFPPTTVASFSTLGPCCAGAGGPPGCPRLSWDNLVEGAEQKLRRPREAEAAPGSSWRSC